MMKNRINSPLMTSIFLILGKTSQAADLLVTETSDDGTGLINGTLSSAIRLANQNTEADRIILTTDVNINGVMKRLIDSDVTIQSDSTGRQISGTSRFRPLFIKSGDVTIENVDIVGGYTEGGSGGGAGAGMGGGIFIYDGDVTLNDVSISHSTAIGGDRGSTGGGGMFGRSAGYGGGGLFENGSGSSGGYGGYGNYLVDGFGMGGNAAENGQHAGFGAGGGGSSSIYGNGGNGGFGGGGGGCYCYGISFQPGQGGFGGSGGAHTGYFYGQFGASGFGADSGFGAGLGGAVFIRSGKLRMTDVSLSNNSAAATAPAKGLGGALFVLHTTLNTNSNNQGMPTSLPTVIDCGATLIGNSASSDIGSSLNNDDLFVEGGNLFTCSDIIFEDGFD